MFGVRSVRVATATLAGSVVAASVLSGCGAAGAPGAAATSPIVSPAPATSPTYSQRSYDCAQSVVNALEPIVEGQVRLSQLPAVPGQTNPYSPFIVAAYRLWLRESPAKGKLAAFEDASTLALERCRARYP